MEEKILKALKGSIEKWKRIVAGKGQDRKYRNCPLCGLILLGYTGQSCFENKCPVAILSHKEGCEATPWEEWESHHQEKHPKAVEYMRVQCPTCKKLAKKELAFLKSLLPK